MSAPDARNSAVLVSPVTPIIGPAARNTMQLIGGLEGKRKISNVAIVTKNAE
jgi:hypothetical protein